MTFIGDGTIEEPIMIRGDFAQVIRFGQTRLNVISETPWQNALSHGDVNHSGNVTSLDALTVVNQLARVSDSTLPPLTSIDVFSGTYFDVSGDGRITALDALRVINEVARRQLSSEGEAISVGLPQPSIAVPAINRGAVKLDRELDIPVQRTSAMVVGHLSAGTDAVFTNRDVAIEELYSVEADESDPVGDFDSNRIRVSMRRPFES